MSINLLNAILADNYKIMVATNGDQAIKAAVKGKPDLILLDVNMPVCPVLQYVNISKNRMKRVIYL